MSGRIDPFRQFLLKLSNRLSYENVKSLKFLINLDGAVDDQCNDVKDVFTVLERKREIAPDNVTYLKELIEEIERHDLVDLIGNFWRILVDS